VPSKLGWEKLKQAFATVKDPQDVALLALAGKTKQGLYDDVGMGRSAVPLDQARPDRALHAATAQAMTSRLGAAPTRALGYGKEIVQGLGQLVKGKYTGFSGPQGYDPSDIAANEAGIQAALRSGLPPPPDGSEVSPIRWAGYLPEGRR
jgi:hypothetical protein